jgi:hypothetical protein
MIKIYENFIEYDKLYDIIKQLENRIKYWFSDGSLMYMNLSQIDNTITDKYSNRSIYVSFSNDNYMYQLIITIYSNDDKGNLILKRYDLLDNNLIDQFQEKIEIDKIKEDAIISKISEFEEKSDNPDEIKIKILDKKDKDKDKDKNENEDNKMKNNDEMENDENKEVKEEDGFSPFNLGGNNEEEEEEF